MKNVLICSSQKLPNCLRVRGLGYDVLKTPLLFCFKRKKYFPKPENLIFTETYYFL
jgi:hypothetical protein